ncbi:MAG TPA: L,D-transpeptidase family protein, partial [Geobacteraceae bacterium]
GAGRGGVMTLRYGALLLLIFTLAGCYPHVATLEPCREKIPGTSRQLVVVARDASVPSGMAARLYEREDTGWRPVGPAFPVAVGRKGLAPVGEKREGDGRTPSGVFPLERGFGYEPLTTRLPYIVLTPEMIWIDDPRSERYNVLAEKNDGAGFSYEIMRRADDLYKYGVVLEYNTRPVVPGAGSAIFFHIWRGPSSSTAGCVAMSERDMVRLLTWLDPARKPLAVIGDVCR